MWQSTWASSVVTRPLKMYQATRIKSGTLTMAPFSTGFRFRNQRPKKKKPAAVAAAGDCGAAEARQRQAVDLALAEWSSRFGQSLTSCTWFRSRL